MSTPVSAPTAAENAVTVAMFKFDPTPLQVKAGTTVTWTNKDEILHTITAGAPGAASGEFDKEMPAAGSTASFTFSAAGRYTYFCSRHQFMQGEIIVNAS